MRNPGPCSIGATREVTTPIIKDSRASYRFLRIHKRPEPPKELRASVN
jgi:hypothetical protein